MRIPRTISFYVLRETSTYCALTFFVLCLVILTQNLLRRLDELFLVGMTLADFAVVLRCLVPIVVSYALPLAFLLGLLLALRRLGSDGELLAMRSAGLGPGALLGPILALGLATSALSGWLIVSVEHEARRELVSLFKRVAARGAILEPGKFRHIGRHVVFVEDRDRAGNLRGVMILDEDRPGRGYRVFADRGQFRFDADSATIHLDLFDGDLHFIQPDAPPERYERMLFEAFTHRMEVGFLLDGEFGPVRPKQMNLPQLNAVIERALQGDRLRELDQRDPLEYQLEIHRRRALPWAPTLFAWVGVPIALASERRGRNLGLIACGIAAFAYYALSSIAASLAASTPLTPALAAWIPNLIFAAVACVFYHLESRRIPQ